MVRDFLLLPRDTQWWFARAIEVVVEMHDRVLDDPDHRLGGELGQATGAIFGSMPPCECPSCAAHHARRSA